MNQNPLVLPAIRGSIGDWIYYACLMPIKEVGTRVQFAEEIHPDKALSQLIQRSLEGPRSKHIAEYLANTKERFFNALVLATYKGSPEWLEVGGFQSTSRPEIVKLIPAAAMDSLGFLSLSGSEKIFAVDGQHRVAGIKRAIAEGVNLEKEQVAVLLVGHKRDAAGMQRTRRLFTTLNKTAVPVRKRDIIALDEDDVMAIIARRLVETNPHFRDPKIAVISSQNIPATNRTCLTTITSLYDTLKLLFLNDVKQRSDRSLRFNRPADARLGQFYDLAVSYFESMGKAFKPVGEVLTSANPDGIAAKQRGPHGGHFLFRPIGLDTFTRTAIAFANTHEINLVEAVHQLKVLPMDIAKPPYRSVVWDPVRQTVIGRGKSLARELLRHMAGLPADDGLLDKYKLALGASSAEKVKLPDKLI